MFCSEPQDGQIFIAERSRKGSRKLFWVSDAKSDDRRRRRDRGPACPPVGKLDTANKSPAAGNTRERLQDAPARHAGNVSV